MHKQLEQRIANQRNVSLGNVTTNVDQANQYAALWPGDSIGQWK